MHVNIELYIVFIYVRYIYQERKRLIMTDFNLFYSDPSRHYVTYTSERDSSKTITITDVDGNLTPKAVVITGLFDQKNSREAVAIVAKATNYDPKKPNNNYRFFGPNSAISKSLPVPLLNSDDEIKIDIDKPTCGRLKPGTYKIGDILTCSYGGSGKEPKVASTNPVRHSRAHAKHTSAPKDTTPEPTIDTSANAGLDAPKVEKPATPPAQAPAPIATQSSATSAPAVTTTTTPAPAPAAPAPAPTAVNKPAPAAQTPAPAATSAPVTPPINQAPPTYYAPQAPEYMHSYAPAYSSGFDPSAMLFGMMGGMGLMTMLGGFGGGGFGFGFGGGFGNGFEMDFGFGGFGSHYGGFGFHHPHHFEGFHHEPFAFHHDGFGGFNHGFGGFEPHHGGFGGGFGFHHGFGRHC